MTRQLGARVADGGWKETCISRASNFTVTNGVDGKSVLPVLFSSERKTA